MIVADMVSGIFEDPYDEDIAIVFKQKIDSIKSFDEPRFRLWKLGVEIRVTLYKQIIIEFSPSKASAEGMHNLNILSQGQIQEQVERVSQLLADCGFRLNFKNGKLRRLDYAIDCILPRHLKEYFFDLKLMDFNGKYVKQVGTTLYFNSSPAVIAVYDKVNECRLKNLKMPLEFVGKNILRFEYRLKTPKKVRTLTGLVCVGESHKALPIISKHFGSVMKGVFHV